MSIRLILRRLARSPLFTAVAVITLAIGIGANSAIFSVLNAVVLNPLPFPHPDELVTLNHAAPGVNLPDAGSAPFLHFTYRDQARSFQDVGLYRWSDRAITGVADPESALSLNVTAQILPILGVPPALGRWFSAGDDSPGGPQTMILAYGWWQARFGGDQAIVGRVIDVDGVPREVIGVMPASFRFLDRDPAFLLPLQLDRNKTVLGQVDYRGLARLKPGVKLEQASSDISRLILIALHSFPPTPGFTVKAFEEVRFAPLMEPLKQNLVGDLSRTLWVLMGTISIVLLIACANVANLLLARAEGRQQELAIRAAIGAGWRDIARELLAESIVLGLIGGALGLGLAAVSIRALVALSPANFPRLHEVSISLPMLLFTFAAALFSGLLFGLIPAVKYAAPRIGSALPSGGRTSSQTRERHRARGLLAVVQVALAVILLVGSGLMLRTFRALRYVDPGFNPNGVLTLRLNIPPSQVKDPVALTRMEQAILDKIREIPAVTAAAITTYVPTDPGGSYYQVYARDRVYQKVPPLRRAKFVSPGLLSAMGNRLIAGREFTWDDAYDHHPVAMISENLAHELWGDPQQAVGKEITANLKDPWREVIGVVGDERSDGMQAKAPTIAYYPLLTGNFDGNAIAARRTISYIIRSREAGSERLLADVRRAVWSADANLPLTSVRTLSEIYSRSMERTTFTLVMLAISGAMALLIGLVGIYGVISYSVSQRRREIGIRMALGARPRELAGLFLAKGMALALVGVACGLTASALLTRVLGSSLFGVSPLDPATYAAVAVSLIVAVLAATYVPAARAMRVDPVEALRSE